MTTYTNPFTGQTINPSQVGYQALTISANTTLQWPINGNNSSVASNIMEVTATSAGLQLALPPGIQVSPGTALIIKNVGLYGTNYSFTVTDSLGNVLVTIPTAPSSSVVNCYYIYLQSNLSVQGTWANIAMGIGASSVAASSLAGAGLQAQGLTLNEIVQPSTVSSNYTFQVGDQAKLFAWTGGAGTLTVSAQASGWFVFVKNNGSGICTLSLQSGTFDGTVQTTLQIQLGNSVCIATDGTNWYSFALGIASTFNYTQLALSLTGLGSPQTLTTVQAQSVIQTYTGVLSTNMQIILPQTVQLYSLSNQTSGAYTLTFKTSYVGGSTLTLPQGQTIIAICDGKNVYNSQTASVTTLPTLTLGNGTVSAPSFDFSNDATSGLYSPASGQLGFSISGTLAMDLSSSGLYVANGISGGTF